MKKRRGISLLVLIITIVAIVVLATAIIVNLAQTNLINNANEAIFKQDVSTLEESLKIYHKDRYIETSGEYNPELLKSDYNGTYYNGELLNINIYDILPGLKGTELDGIVYIQKGKLVLDGNSLTNQEKEWSENVGVIINGKPIIRNISVQSDKTQISVNVTVSESSKIGKYKYRVNEEDWVETEQSSYIFNDLQVTTKYNVSVIVVSESGDESDIYEEVVYTLGNEQDLQIVPETSEYVAGDLKVEIIYENNIPEEYELQYRLTKENGTVVVQDWVSYDSNVGITLNENMVISARIYNSSSDDELVSTSKAISTIDIEAPSKPTAVELSFGTNSVTATASGSTDIGSGLLKYQYSKDGSNWYDNGTFSGIKSGTAVTIYARAVDKVGRVSETTSNNGSTTTVTAPTLNVELENPVLVGSTNWTKTKAVGTLTGIAPEGYELQYKLTKENGTVVVQDWTKYTGQVNITENNVTMTGRYYNSSVDDEIVSNPTSKTTSNIDKNVPDITNMTVSVTAATNSVTATASGSTDVGSGLLKYQYSKDGSNWYDSGTFSGIKSGTAVTIYARAIDKVGNVSGSKSSNSISTSNIGAVTITPSTTAWISGNVTVTLSHTAVSGYKLQYKIGTGSWTDYSSAITISSNTTVHGRMYNTTLDDEGNSAASKSITNIDKDAPDITNMTVSVTAATNSVTATASGATDAISGVSKYQYSLSSTSGWQDSGIFSGIKSGTAVTVYARAIDKAGNASGSKSSNSISTSSIGAVTITPSTTAWTSGSITVTLSHTAVSGYKLQYKIGTGSWTDYSSAITISSNTTVHGRMYNTTLDDEGNSAASKSITNIDLSDPSKPTNITFTKTYTSITATASGSTDVGSGFAKYQYSLNGTSGWQDSGTFSGYTNGKSVTVYARAVDKVGRVSERSDAKSTTTTPLTTPTISVNTTAWTQSVTVTIAGSVPSGYQLQYKLNSGSWTKYSSALTITTNNTVVNARIVSTSNSSDYSATASKTITNIDTLPPDSFTPFITLGKTQIRVYGSSSSSTAISDKAATTTSGCSGGLTYAFSWNSGSTYTAYQSSNNYLMNPTTLGQGIVFANIRVRIKDAAGNVRTVSGPTYKTATVRSAATSTQVKIYTHNSSLDVFVLKGGSVLSTGSSYPLYGIWNKDLYTSTSSKEASAQNMYRVRTSTSSTTNYYVRAGAFVQ